MIHIGVPDPLSYIPPICWPANGNRAEEMVLPDQKMKYRIAAEIKPIASALASNINFSLGIGLNSRDNTARMAAEREIFIQNMDQVK